MLTRLPLARRIALAALSLTMLASIAPWSASPVQAARLFRGGRTVIAETDTIHDDVYVAGGNLTVRGVIDGDVVAAGGHRRRQTFGPFLTNSLIH